MPGSVSVSQRRIRTGHRPSRIIAESGTARIAAGSESDVKVLDGPGRRVTPAQDDGCPRVDSTAPEGAAVTFQYTEIFVCEEVWGHVSYGRDREAIILTPQDDVSATMLASVGQLDPTDLSRVEEVMDALSALKVIVKSTGG